MRPDLACAVFLALLALLAPAVASSEPVLMVFGNANMDKTLDQEDVNALREMLAGAAPPTQLADANADGKIDLADLARTEEILAGAESELVVIDAANRTVRIPMPATRLVVFSTTYAEAVRILGASGQVVGTSSAISKDGEYFSDLGGLPSIGSMWTPDLEALISLRPDLVLTSKKDPVGLEEQLPPNITVVRMEFTDPDTLETEIRMLGLILGRRQAAEGFAGYYRGHLALIEKRLAGQDENDRPLVYMEYSKEYGAAGRDSALERLCTLAGGKNLGSQLKGDSPVVDAEWLMAQDPRFMVKWTSRDKLEQARGELLSRPGLSNVSAVKNGSVYAVSYEVTTRPACFVGVAYLAKWLYPQLFADMDPKEIHMEYLKRFQGIDDPQSLGAFVYPAEA
ncbi:MAG TPA: ABC transporter substrate-binding protein [Methanotrichaceae archaeon]|nr:ABC transporter substrate-binding protein [Methanotrichaceae archaeon]HQF15768.1 ABC transporter substrate-binding protein [Methanotrichaceae archaeon]HQI90558.1 ABC transporter substrate-binding protein [Methanotrichaceae archaeon]